jgi:ferredoxin-NADP reductase/ferredoxin
MSFRFEGKAYEGDPCETVLEALLRQDVALPYSCRKGLCQVCLVRSAETAPPAASQIGLRDTLRHQGYFLACQCPATDGLDISLARAADVFIPATVIAKQQLSTEVYKIELMPAGTMAYHPGQFINLRRADGLSRSYSIASVPQTDNNIEIHVQRRENGLMSQWLIDTLQPGEHLEIDGPNGMCFYLPGNEAGPLLMIGTGTGLAPLIGIVRDALLRAHSGPIYLYHGSRSPAGFYARQQLLAMAALHPQLHVHFCVSGENLDQDCLPGYASKNAFARHGDLSGFRVYLCGAPEMVRTAQKTAYLQGAQIKNIYADPFENLDKRNVQRN